MLDLLYSLGQTLCLLGLAYGAILAINTSETFIALGQARFERRLRTRRERRLPVDDDPDIPMFRYCP
jgi:hypothetical protein